MTNIAFYQLQQSPLEAVLPKLLEHTLKANKKAIVQAGTQEQLAVVSSALWTQYSDSWLPHGMGKDRFAEDQLIWLTTDEENPSGATFIFLIDGAEAVNLENYERCFDLFNGNAEVSLAAARKRWKSLKEAGHDLQYWLQNDKGKWEEKVSQ